MKRSQCIDLILNWAKPEILQDVYNNNYEEWADNLLYTLETEYGICPPKRKSKIWIHGSDDYDDVNEWDAE